MFLENFFFRFFKNKFTKNKFISLKGNKKSLNKFYFFKNFDYNSNYLDQSEDIVPNNYKYCISKTWVLKYQGWLVINIYIFNTSSSIFKKKRQLKFYNGPDPSKKYVTLPTKPIFKERLSRIKAWRFYFFFKKKRRFKFFSEKKFNQLNFFFIKNMYKKDFYKYKPKFFKNKKKFS